MSERKDRLIQARVDEGLEATLKREARRRRTSVSQLIRNVLEDAFQLVDGVVTNVDRIVGDSVELAQQVGRDAREVGRDVREIGRVAREAGRSVRRAPDVAGEPPPPCHTPLPDTADRLERVAAWNPAVLNRAVPCARCGAELEPGRRAYVGLGEEPGAPLTWVCAAAVEDPARPPGTQPGDAAPAPRDEEETR